MSVMWRFRSDSIACCAMLHRAMPCHAVPCHDALPCRVSNSALDVDFRMRLFFWPRPSSPIMHALGRNPAQSCSSYTRSQRTQNAKRSICTVSRNFSCMSPSTFERTRIAGNVPDLFFFCSCLHSPGCSRRLGGDGAAAMNKAAQQFSRVRPGK